MINQEGFGTLEECKRNGHWWDFQRSDGFEGGGSYYVCDKCEASKTVTTHVDEPEDED